VTALTLTKAIAVTPVLASAFDLSAAKDVSPVGVHYVSISRISDLLNSTAIYALLKLESLANSYPNLIDNIDDARIFAKSLPGDLVRPEIWTDAESEIAFEWKHGSHHAMVSFEGNGSFGYAIRRGNRFVPGAFPGDLKAGIPRDLVNYLSGKTSA
jgi:hypothetical protein